jgi:DUF971 family protein
MSAPPPTVFRAHRDAKEFEIAFADGRAARIPFRTLRWLCPCAMCLDELSGVRILRREDVPLEIVPTQLEPSGNYAVRICWSDGHSTGIYTWDRLYELAGLPPS